MLGRVVRRVIGLLALLSGIAAGCGIDCETADSDPVRFEGGLTRGSLYETSGWEGPFLHFPPGRRFQLMHRLGTVPAEVKTYLAFSSRGPADGSNATESAGNQVVIEVVNDELIQVRNDTCADFHLRLVARADGSDAGAGD
jgi:hypothetical protein